MFQTKNTPWPLLMLFLFPVALISQNYKGKVISAENSIELYEVVISDTLGIQITQTDRNGSFSIEKPGVYTFSKKGYYSRSLRLDQVELTIVELREVPLNLNEVTIRTNHFESELKKISSPISLISQVQIKSNSTINLAPILNTTPGVYMHNGTLSTNRITIRGIGSRNLFGTSKIRAYYQDIPLTNGSGETTVEDIEISGIGRMEILKGPSSSLYGAGLGGTIQIIPDKGLFDNNSLHAEYLFGSFGLQKLLINTNLGNKTNSANFTYSNTHSDGYRDNNELDRQTFTLASNHYLNESDNLVIIGNFIDLKAFIPSSLNEDDYLHNPEAAAFTWGRAQGFEDYSKLLLGLSWQHIFKSDSKLLTSVFGSFLDSYEARPFNILNQDTKAFGVRSRYISRHTLFNKELQWTTGLELFNDINAIKTFENLYQEFPPGTGSVQGEQLSDFDENRFYINAFMDFKYHISEKTILDFGLNYNKTIYRLEDRFNSGPDNFSGDYSFKGILSPKIGMTYQLFETNMLFASISHGFSTPKLEEVLLPDGLINIHIQPETGWNYEIGSRGSFIKNIFNYDVSIYLMDVDNLLVARRTGDDEFIGVNAGNTVHKGIELSINYFILDKTSIQISHRNGLSLNHYKFKEFKVLDEDYSGNDLTGVPDKTFNSQVFINTKMGFYAYVNYQYVGVIPIRDDNSVFSDSYQVVNTKIGYKNVIGEKLGLGAYIGFNNLFDEKYASMLQINAGSFGNNAPRYYYPGEPSNYYMAINFNYTF